ncbi:FkbM family methyltransferase [Bernardetia sp.]|uniref:FkbM family methyltransferase n=1 Tax=Bernardetia sp. TaxID=1937974 RepID=UPI0025BA7DD0|nr:FkbM family methyltransferase [Bernardetia sp.]
MGIVSKGKYYLQEIAFNFSKGDTFGDKLGLTRQVLSFHWYNQKQELKRVEEKAIKHVVQFPQGKQDVHLRTHSGDMFVFYEIFMEDTYLLPKEWTKNVKSIVDLGANIGLTTLYYYQMFPEAHFVCVEAAPTNFNILEKNLHPISSKNQLTALEGAIYSQSGEVAFETEAIAWGGKINQDTQSITTTKVRAYDIPEVMQKAGIEEIDILKIDIEGGEEELLGKNKEWLHKVKVIIIELHGHYDLDRLKTDISPYGFEIILPTEQEDLQMIAAIAKERLNK